MGTLAKLVTESQEKRVTLEINCSHPERIFLTVKRPFGAPGSDCQVSITGMLSVDTSDPESQLFLEKQLEEATTQLWRTMNANLRPPAEAKDDKPTVFFPWLDEVNKAIEARENPTGEPINPNDHSHHYDRPSNRCAVCKKTPAEVFEATKAFQAG